MKTILAVAVALGLSMAAYPQQVPPGSPSTAISDTLYDLGGVTFTGTIYVELVENQYRNSKTVPVTSGAVSLSLYPGKYTVRATSHTTGLVLSDTWVVPDSGSPQTLTQLGSTLIRIPAPSGGTGLDLSGVPAGAVLTNASGVVAGASVKAATSAELAGVDLVTNGTFASGLSGWTTAGGWSIVSGRLHHTPGTANKIYRAITVTQYDTYLQQVQVFSQSAGTANVNLGVDCNSDCGEVLSVGSNPWDLVASSDNGATVIEIQPDSASDITISSVGLIHAFPSLYLSALGNSNAADGALALHSNTIGYSNLASGPFALFSNTEGRFNAAVGASSLQACTGLDCSANAGVGAFSLASNRSSPGNTAVGRYAGSGVVSGNGLNVFIGTNSGTTKADIENSVCIAANCSVALDNQTVIGNSSTVRTDVFGILADGNFIWDSASQLLTVGDESGLPGDIQGYVNYGRLYVPGLVGVAVNDNIGVYIATAATATGAQGVQVESTALADGVNLIDFTDLPAVAAGHHAANVYSFSNYYGGTVQAGAILDSYYFAYSKPLVGDGSIGNMVSYYAEDLAPGQGTTKYYNWFDSRGVRRVKEDNTFDSVGQAIEALYNPQFTKYTPGAANFERVVLGQWNGNVAEIGNQAGGTGTLRPLRLIGSSVEIPGAVLTVQVPDVVPTGVSNTSGGGTYYEYWVIAKFPNGKSTGAPINFNPAMYAIIEDGPATLDVTHYNDISWSAVTGATGGYEIWTDDREGTVSSTGLLGTVAAGTLTFRDNGAAGNNVVTYAINTTGSLSLDTVTLNTCVGCGILFNFDHGSIYVGNGFSATNPMLSAIGLDGGANVAVGKDALQSATTGSNSNTAIGVGSQQLNTTGTNNTSLGLNSLLFTSTGDFNVAIGEGALLLNNGDANTVVGEEAGNNLTAVNQNTIVGAEAWKTQATGDFNTILGAKAGGDSSGSRNVFIGYSAGKSDTGSDHLCIDVSDRADCLVSGDFAARTLFFNARVGESSHTPASSSEVCTTGQRTWDTSFEYHCVSTNTWKSVPLQTFGYSLPTFPSGTIVGTTDTQTLTNKSIDAGQVTGTLAAGRGGGLVLLQSQTAAASASLSFTSCFSSTYDEYKIEVIGLTQGTSGAAEILQFSTNGGSSYDTSSIYDWNIISKQFGSSTDFSSQTNANAITLWSDSSRVGPASTATPGLVESMTIYDPLSASNYKAVVSQGIGHYNGNTSYYMFQLTGLYKSVTAVNAFKISATSGTFSGTVRCYGIGH